MEESVLKRICELLSWSRNDVMSMSLQSLREFVRPMSDKLCAELDGTIRSGNVIAGRKKRR